MASFLIEAVVDSMEAALAAEAAGADRLELCSGLELGGLTPGPGLLRQVCAGVRVPVHVLVRPRGGDFLYTQAEIETLLLEAIAAREAGAAGIVVGLLLPNGDIDVPRMRFLVEAVSPLPVTFHRAFDRVPNLERGCRQLLDTGCNRVLSSGLAGNAFDGADNLRWLREKTKGRLEVMPGGGVTAANVRAIAKITGASEFHFSAIQQAPSAMNAQAAQGPSEAKTWVPAPEKVHAIRTELIDYFRGKH